MKTFLLVDGENFKGMIKKVLKEEGVLSDNFLWHAFDFKGLLDKVLKGIDISEAFFYFAKIKSHDTTKKKSLQLIEQQRLLKTHLERQGFEVILQGNVRGQMTTNSNGKEVLVFREKGVDVKIAVDMITAACDKVINRIVLASSDSDLQPAIIEVTKNRNIECVYLGFETYPNKGISYTTKRTILIRNSEILDHIEIQKKLKMECK